MEKNRQIAIIGMGTFGIETAKSLMAADIAVTVIDHDAEIIESVKDLVTTALIMDTTQEKSLLEAEIDKMDIVVVAIGSTSLENSIMTTALLKQLGVKTIIARAINDLHERILKQVGATAVVNPERDMGERVARRIAQPGLLDMVNLPDDICIAKIPVPTPFVGHTLVDINVRQNYGLTVLGIERLKNGANHQDYSSDQLLAQLQEDPDTFKIIMNINPAKEVMQEGDLLLVMGHTDAVNALADNA